MNMQRLLETSLVAARAVPARAPAIPRDLFLEAVPKSTSGNSLRRVLKERVRG